MEGDHKGLTRIIVFTLPTSKILTKGTILARIVHHQHKYSEGSRIIDNLKKSEKRRIGNTRKVSNNNSMKKMRCCQLTWKMKWARKKMAGWRVGDGWTFRKARDRKLHSNIFTIYFKKVKIVDPETNEETMMAVCNICRKEYTFKSSRYGTYQKHIKAKHYYTLDKNKGIKTQLDLKPGEKCNSPQKACNSILRIF